MAPLVGLAATMAHSPAPAAAASPPSLHRSQSEPPGQATTASTARQPRPLLPVIHSAKAFNVTSSLGSLRPEESGDLGRRSCRDFCMMSRRTNNPNESMFHMQARLGFSSRSAPKGNVRLRPLGGGRCARDMLSPHGKLGGSAGGLKSAEGHCADSPLKLRQRLRRAPPPPPLEEEAEVQAQTPQVQVSRPPSSARPSTEDYFCEEVGDAAVGRVMRRALGERFFSDLGSRPSSKALGDRCVSEFSSRLSSKVSVMS
eukprot:TRINITY_DN14097_c0_g1_i1.p1 TRINITY_DN14097_c0_g1~~TRINITY_DN14097_c0_g1_i1.p1  ORF type:complete len:257 (+),score=45.45 TRINITY_DN14097_c0_g1_i1:71-841(+)